MEVAGQWRRQWAGAAEYGKVTEGGVTRRVARAMEVVHASGPGARMRVMRAAYHSSAGPGVPASSYMLHSSRRVISSGSNFLESPSFPSKPFEISSIPLESLPDNNNAEIENYKVTEPDDFEISEPSKWKASSDRISIRMPSEESSSADNASVIDLDSRTHRGIFRKCSYDSECSDVQPIKRSTARTSPLLDAPSSLSTLKYKSLLNGSSDWNSRRKSYSFEDTSPLNETVLHSNDTLAMESSTDSGICKSTEIVNDHIDETNVKHHDRKAKKFDTQEETFEDWLTKNRPSSYYKGTTSKSYREHNIVIEDEAENSIALQSRGKVSITLPITIEKDDEYQYKKTHISDDGDRRVKKVEFCKTELHFAAESGKVNIIATDEKPPPTNDFRKRRSAFVPIHSKFDKPITLFGEKIVDFPEINNDIDFSSVHGGNETDENTAATKSILKNKIPKPKPYLLGENMVFGNSDDKFNNDSTVLTAVSLINKQLQSGRRYSNETTSSFTSDTETNIVKDNIQRTSSKGPVMNDTLKINEFEQFKKPSSFSGVSDSKVMNSVQHKLNFLHMSPIQTRSKTRQLRDSDLMYFGISDNKKKNKDNRPIHLESKLPSEKGSIDDLFHSVRLIQQVSNSVCNSEAESDDPDYQNFPLKTNFAPVPTPRSRTKYDDKPKGAEVRILKPIIEQDIETVKGNIAQDSRRSRSRRYEEVFTSTNRSRSEPPNTNRYKISEQARHKHHIVNVVGKETPSPRSEMHCPIEENEENSYTIKIQDQDKNKEQEPLYANFNINKNIERELRINKQKQQTSQAAPESKYKHNEGSLKKSYIKSKCDDKVQTTSKRHNIEKIGDGSQNKNSLKKNNEAKRTERLIVPEHSSDDQRKNSSERTTSTVEKKSVDSKEFCDKKNQHTHQSRSSQRHLTNNSLIKATTEEVSRTKKTKDSEPAAGQRVIGNEVKKRHRNVSKDKPKVKKEENESSKSISKYDSISLNRHNNSTRSKSKEVNDTVSSANSENHKLSNRSEYVINYDDKNGVVSSVRKVKHGHNTSIPKRKKSSQEKVKESSKDKKVKNKTPEKTALLQPQDRQWKANGLNNGCKKWKTTVHVQRTCQLL